MEIVLINGRKLISEDVLLTNSDKNQRHFNFSIKNNVKLELKFICFL